MSGFTKKKRSDDPLRGFRQKTVETGKIKSSGSTVYDHEDDACRMIGGKRHAGSGAISGLKSDGSSKRYQVEAKQTEHMQIALKMEWIEKITMEAVGKARVPLIHIRFLNCPIGVDGDLVVVSSREFKKLFDLARGNDETIGRWIEE